MVPLDRFFGDGAPFVEHVCRIVFPFEGDEFLVVGAVEVFGAGGGEICGGLA